MDTATVYKNDMYKTEIRRTSNPDRPYLVLICINGLPYRAEEYRWLASATEAVQKYEKNTIPTKTR